MIINCQKPGNNNNNNNENNLKTKQLKTTKMTIFPSLFVSFFIFPKIT